MKAVLSGRLQIVSMPLRRCDIHAVRNAVDEARSEMPVHMIIIDSGDHMQPTAKWESKRLEQAEVYWDLKTLAEEEGLVVWSSTQAGREWESRTAGAEAVSESYDKARIADAILTLNAVKSDRSRSKEGAGDVEAESAESEAKNKLEVYLAKYRDGESKTRIPLDPDFSTMLIREDEDDERKE
jgi:replicative DNA helicase